MFRETELKILETGDGSSIKEIAESIETDPSHISRTVKTLQNKGLLKAKRNRKKTIHIKDNKVVELYQKLNEEHPHINFPKLLKGKKTPILHYLDQPRSVKEIANKTNNYRNTTHRIIKKLHHRGIIKKKNNKYSLKKEFQTLNQFAKEYIHHTHRNKSEKNYTILWETLTEFLIQTSEKIEEDNFHLTGPALFQEYGLPLLNTTKNHYFYTEKIKKIEPKELIYHTLLIDKGTRYQTYCLLLIKKEEINEKELLRKAEKYRLKETIKTLNEYLKTQGKQRTLKQPEWQELKKLAKEYGVQL